MYADADTVQLLVNGRSVGRKKVKECKALFSKVTYEPGEIEAIALDAAAVRREEPGLSPPREPRS